MTFQETLQEIWEDPQVERIRVYPDYKDGYRGVKEVYTYKRGNPWSMESSGLFPALPIHTPRKRRYVPLDKDGEELSDKIQYWE